MSEIVIEIGTCKIICLKSKNENFYSSYIVYDGIKNNSWLAPLSVFRFLEQAVVQCERRAGKRIKNVCVGVPNCFVDVKLKQAEVHIENGKVSSSHIKQLEEGCHIQEPESWQLIEKRASYYIDDEQNVYIKQPLGIKTEYLSACYSSFFAFTPFIKDVEKMLGELAIECNGYLVQSMCQANYYIDEAVRDAGCIIVDIGYFDTDISIVYGDSILGMNTIHAGGAQIANDIKQIMEIDDITAENLKRVYAFGMAPGEDNKIFARNSEKKNIGFDRALVGQIIEARVEHLCVLIDKIISEYSKFITPKTPVYLFGSGISMQQGAGIYLKNHLKRDVFLPDVKKMRGLNTNYSTAVSLLDNCDNQVYHLIGEHIDDGNKLTKFIDKLMNK